MSVRRTFVTKYNAGIVLERLYFFDNKKIRRRKKQKKSNLFSLSLLFSSLLFSPLFYESESTQTIRMIELVRSGRSV